MYYICLYQHYCQTFVHKVFNVVINLTFGGLIMPLSLSFSISNSVTQEEWEKVYEKTLFLAEKLNLADWNKFYYRGIRAEAFCTVKEQKEKEYGEVNYYWKSNSEYNLMLPGAMFRLRRKLKYYKFNKDSGPAILNSMDFYLTGNHSDRFSDQTTSMLYIENIGGAYHVRLLAILCFIESKLKEKIFIGGDIDFSECKDAVELANKFLDEPINELPARCDYRRLYEIIQKLDISDNDKIYLMERTYLGEIDINYKNFIEQKFGKTVIKKFWKNRFSGCNDINDSNFEFKIHKYFTYGFSFKDLLSYIPFSIEKESLSKFLEIVLSTYTTDSRISRIVGITRNPKDNIIRGIPKVFYNSLYGKDVNILNECPTLDNLVNGLTKYFDDEITIRKILKEHITDEAEDQFITRVKKSLEEDDYYSTQSKQYDIFISYYLLEYRTGDKLSPYLMKEIKTTLSKCKKSLDDEEFKELEKKDITEQIYELIDLKPYFPVRDIDWRHAIDYFHTHSDALKRYYPLFCLSFEYFSATPHIAKALFINDEFYEFCKSL